MIKNSIYKNCLVIIFLVFSNNIFSRDFCKEYCPDCCDCCDCCKKGNETEEDEKNISVKSSFKSDVSEDKANIDNNLEEEIDNLNKESNAFKYLKIQEAIDVYNDETNNKILSYNNLRNKIILYKNLVGIEGFNEEDIKKFVDNKEYNNCNYDFEGIMNLFKKSLENNKQLIPTEKFFKYFYHPEYLETNFNLWGEPRSKYLDDNSKNFGYIKLSQTECDNDNVGKFYSADNNILTNYFKKYYSYFINFYKIKLHQIYKWLDDNQKIANLNDPENIYTLLDIITKQRVGSCKNEAENIISSMYSTIISYMNKSFKIGDFEVFTYSILSDFRQAVAKDVVNMMISQPNENNCLKSKTNNDKIDVDSAQEKANIIRIYLNSFLNTNIGFSQVMSYLSFFDKAVEQANTFLKEFFNFNRLFEIILQYTKQAQANGNINNFIEEIKEIEVTYSDICAITAIPEVKIQIERKIKAIDNESSKKSFEERLNKYLNIDNNDILRNWKENNSKKPFKELIKICKQDYEEDVSGNCDHYFYLPELTEFYFNKDLDNIINYFNYILFPLYLLKENYIKIKS